MEAVTAGVVAVELVVEGLPKIPEPKILLVVFVVDTLVVEAPLSPVVADVPLKSPLVTLGAATRKGSTFSTYEVPVSTGYTSVICVRWLWWQTKKAA